MAAGSRLGFDPTRDGAVRSAIPETPPRSKLEGHRLTRCKVMGVSNFCKMCELALRSVGRWSVGGQIHIIYKKNCNHLI